MRLLVLDIRAQLVEVLGLDEGVQNKARIFRKIKINIKSREIDGNSLGVE
jgi:hypothetical protein